MAERSTQASMEANRLKPSSELETVPVSRLARKGTELLSRLAETSEAVAVQVQGVGSMVTLSRRRYDEIVAMVNNLGREPKDDDFARALSTRFDALVANMNQPGAPEAVDAALFADPDVLNDSYQPGTTETSKG
ncbi:MAG: hypothetical protein EA419_00790 [Wenzhouxiangella sp.]|nr:MAG: hypothetical protein EA419_00790 [Wenzhouxiangella sp.]